MKKFLISVFVALAILGASAQTKSQPTDSTGKAKTEQVTNQPTQGKKVKNNGTPTGRTCKGRPVYKGAKGGLYVIRVSNRTGNEYKQYVKEQQLDKQ